MKNAAALVGFIVIAFVPSMIGTQFPPDAWYAALAKPSWNPPSWVFAPVWTTLYLLIGISGWLVWRAGAGASRGPAFIAYGVQLALNAAWSWLFFGLHRPGWAFAEILLMWAAILATIVLFWRVRALAGALLLPYLAWVSFASVLNGTLWSLNR